MPDAWERNLPTWLVVLTAILGPIVLAFLFVVAMDAVHVPDAQWRSDPNAGYTQAGNNEAVLLLYGLVQVAFLMVSPWAMTQRPGARRAFLSIAIPLCGLLSFIAIVSQLAG